MSPPLKISVGVVAWNEESSIALALESILRQTIFRRAGDSGFETELIIIANGCTDGTVDAAEAFLETVRPEFSDTGSVQLRVEEVPEAGFANAWNLLSHTFSRPDADFIFFVNADIVIDQPEAFEWMLNAIGKDADLQVVSPLGRKHIENAKKKRLRDRINLAVTRFTESNQTAQVRGHCLCATASAMRKVWLPKALPGAVDGCFKRLIVSDMASAPDHPARVGLASNASYTFEAYLTLREMYFRRVRLFVGQAFIETLMRHLRTMRSAQPALNLTGWLRAHDETDPSWLNRLVQLEIRKNGLFATMPSPWFRFRFLRNPRIHLIRKISMVPVAVLSFLFDVPVFLSAARRLKTGRVEGVWRDTRNRTMKTAPGGRE